MPESLSMMLPAVAVIVGIGLSVLVIAVSIRYIRSITRSSGKWPGVETAEVSVEVVDEITGAVYRDANHIIARPQSQSDQDGDVDADMTEQIDLTAGEGKTELGYGDWIFEVEQDGQTVGKRRHRLKYGFDTEHLGLPVDPYTVDVQVIGGPESEPLEEAIVEATADAGGWKRKQPTDEEGRARFEAPRSASTVSFTAEYGDRSVVESEQQVEQAAQDGVTLAMGTESGGLAVETTIDDQPWPEIDVRIAPVSEGTQAYIDDGTVTTNSHGSRTITNLPTGEYEVSADPDLETVEATTARESVRIEADTTAEVTLSIEVAYSIEEANRERLARLRDRIGELGENPNHDVAIPRYYGTVLASILDTVEAVESAPERAVGAKFPPDAVVEALLDATEAGLDAVTDAMSDRRVASLFAVCESMQPAQVDWHADPALGAFLDRVRAGSNQELEAFRDRLAETDTFLDQQWSEVNEDAPVRKLHERLEDLAQETADSDTELAVVARTYVGICLLAAIEELFEHDSLVERINGRTL